MIQIQMHHPIHHIALAQDHDHTLDLHHEDAQTPVLHAKSHVAAVTIQIPDQGPGQPARAQIHNHDLVLVEQQEQGEDHTLLHRPALHRGRDHDLEQDVQLAAIAAHHIVDLHLVLVLRHPVIVVEVHHLVATFLPVDLDHLQDSQEVVAGRMNHREMFVEIPALRDPDLVLLLHATMRMEEDMMAVEEGEMMGHAVVDDGLIRAHLVGLEVLRGGDSASIRRAGASVANLITINSAWYLLASYKVIRDACECDSTCKLRLTACKP